MSADLSRSRSTSMPMAQLMEAKPKIVNNHHSHERQKAMPASASALEKVDGKIDGLDVKIDGLVSQLASLNSICQDLQFTLNQQHSQVAALTTATKSLAKKRQQGTVVAAAPDGRMSLQSTSFTAGGAGLSASLEQFLRAGSVDGDAEGGLASSSSRVSSYSHAKSPSLSANMMRSVVNSRPSILGGGAGPGYGRGPVSMFSAKGSAGSSMSLSAVVPSNRISEMSVTSGMPGLTTVQARPAAPIAPQKQEELGPVVAGQADAANGDKSATPKSASRRFSTSIASVLSSATHQSYPWQVSLWNFLEYPETSSGASLYYKVMPFFTVLTVLLTVVENVPNGPLVGTAALVSQFSIEVLFTTEILLRFMVSPNRKVFVSNVYNIVDMINVVPLIFRIVIVTLDGGRAHYITDPRGWRGFMLLCIVPTLRLLKVIRRFEAFQLLIGAFQLVIEAMPVLLYTQLLMTLIFSSIIFIAEPADNISSLPTAMWLTIVTMTTVGYGDITPTGAVGSVVVAVLVVCSVMITAFPLGIIGHTFCSVWSDRDRIMLMQRTRDCLTQWGFSLEDVCKLFQYFDKDCDGELNLEEFCAIFSMMKVAMPQERIVDLFNAFDYDFSGSISQREFLRMLFPGQPDINVLLAASENDDLMNSQEDGPGSLQSQDGVIHEGEELDDEAEEKEEPPHLPALPFVPDMPSSPVSGSQEAAGPALSSGSMD